MELKFILESLLFSAQKLLSVKELRDVLASDGRKFRAGKTINQRRKLALKF
jgi:hypothetical protein